MTITRGANGFRAAGIGFPRVINEYRDAVRTSIGHSQVWFAIAVEIPDGGIVGEQSCGVRQKRCRRPFPVM
jgi:hypothetical protein